MKYLFRNASAALLILCAAGNVVANEPSDSVDAIHDQLIEVTLPNDIYTAQVGVAGFTPWPPEFQQDAQPIPEASLPDNGRVLEGIRQALLDGYLTGEKSPPGPSTCHADGKTQDTFWVLFNDGLFVGLGYTKAIAVKHAPTAWSKQYGSKMPPFNVASFSLDHVRAAGRLIGILHTQPCITDRELFAQAGADALTLFNVRYKPFAAPLPPPPPPPAPGLMSHN